MELKDVLAYQLEASGKQVVKVLEGLGDDQWDAKTREDCMSPRETLAHLTECYIAAHKHTQGEQHEWGSYVPNDEDPQALFTEMQAQRSIANDALLAKADEDSIKAATDYIVLHDAYHVGQLATLRLGLDPNWDAYSIYS